MIVFTSGVRARVAGAALAATLLLGLAPPSAGALPGPAAIEGEQACFIQRTVGVFLARGHSRDEMNQWLDWMKTNPPSGMARELANSEAWLGATVDGIYQDALDRGPDPAGRDFWVGRLRAGAKVNDIGASIYGSSEFYNMAGGNAEGFVWSLKAFSAIFLNSVVLLIMSFCFKSTPVLGSKLR
ncbi:MAG: DUF4214 domain-containing protein [Aquihabitans sp.]